MSKAVAQWNALDLEAAIDEARVCGGMVRTNAEWLETPHGKVLAAKPIVEIIKIADSDPEPLPEGDRPLAGIRALDLTRILAGPIAARTLAENGAEVLMVAGEGVPQIAEHVIDTSHGKRSCYLNLKAAEDAARLKELVRDADVFSQGYRPGILAGLGFAPDVLAAIRPGIICCSISCYGADGPFSHRGGWEQVAQTMTGICQEGSPERPKLLPGAACDYTTGYLGAYGILLALARRAREGGSYHVRVSLCQSGMFVYRQGKTGAVDPSIGSPKPSSTRCASPRIPRPARCGISARSSRFRRPSPTGPGRRRCWAATRPNGPTRRRPRRRSEGKSHASNVSLTLSLSKGEAVGTIRALCHSCFDRLSMRLNGGA